MTKSTSATLATDVPHSEVPWKFNGGLDEIRLVMYGEQELPMDHPSGDSKLCIDVELEHMDGSFLTVKLAGCVESSKRPDEETTGALRIQPDALPLLVATLTEAARQFEERGLRRLISDKYKRGHG